MWKSRGYTRLVPCVTLALIAAATACSSSTSPGGSSGKVTTPGNAASGDTINLAGTYDLASATVDSADGNSSSAAGSPGNGGTLVLTSTAFTLTWTGEFVTGNGTGQSGTYVAVDTSSSVDRGTIALASSKNQAGTYLFSTDTLTITLPQSGGGADVTVWIKQ